MSFWADRKVLVTGATGFVGAHLTARLVKEAAHVVCLQRDFVPNGPLDLLDLRRSVTIVNGQVEDYCLMQRVLSEYEVESVFHLAAQTLVGAANRAPLSTFESNIRGTYGLLEACRSGQTVKRIVVASSDKAYGTHSDLPYREGTPLDGLFPYDASKVCTDVLARSFANTYGLPVAVTRFANIYGPADLNLSRIIPGTIVSVLRDEPPLIRSDGTPLRDFVYVDDAVTGYLQLAENISAVKGEAFNFGSGSPVRILDLATRIIKLAGKQDSLSPKVLSPTKIAGEIDTQYLSAEKIERQLGWRPTIKLDEGLNSTIEWYRRNLSLLP
ncbi:MAG TPA: NAD-dependent epimerase/dehydratase family protein [Pyrinomonadaceae bacterium]|nr:NAD-dependent epimerase/dehydratase family protein [Pyrinomonadaceae bacterium]